MANEIFTRIQLKYDSYANWTTNNPTLLAGEIAIAKLVNDVTVPVDASKNAPVLFKVGPGAFNDLPWASALAADVYGWAKKSNVKFDGENHKIIFTNGEADTSPIDFDFNVLTEADAVTLLESYYTKTEIDGITGNLNELNTENKTNLVTAINEALQAVEVGGTGSVVTVVKEATATEGSTATYTIKQGGNAVGNKIEIPDVETKLQTEGKLHTQTEIETIAANKIGALISAADDEDEKVIANIADLVNYVEENAGEIAKLVTNVETANTNASSAVATAEEAKATAEEAFAKAEEALDGANGAAASAAAAKTSEDNAKASENAAGASASAASASADAASNSADEASASADAASESASFASYAQATSEAAKSAAEEAQGKAEAAKSQAETAKGAAETAQSAAESARDEARSALLEAAGARDLAAESATAAETAQAKAEEAQGKAEIAQSAAEQAKSDAETAKQAAEAAQAAAEASNTSATAIANEAKNTADAAKTASDAATEAVAGLQAIATSGSIYDVKEGSTVSVGTDNTQKYLIFNCGTSTTVL